MVVKKKRLPFVSGFFHIASCPQFFYPKTPRAAANITKSSSPVALVCERSPAPVKGTYDRRPTVPCATLGWTLCLVPPFSCWRFCVGVGTVVHSPREPRSRLHLALLFLSVEADPCSLWSRRSLPARLSGLPADGEGIYIYVYDHACFVSRPIKVAYNSENM